MNNFEKNLVNNLTQCKDKPASYLTHALKQIGGGENGTMAEGMLRIVNRLICDKKQGEIVAFFGGIVTGSVLVTVYLKKKNEECQKIINTLESEIASAESASKTTPNVDQVMNYE